MSPDLAKVAAYVWPMQDIRPLAGEWLIHLQAARRSPKTIKSYREAAEQFADFLASTGMPVHVPDIKREHVEAFILALLERVSASTAATRYRALQQLFRWLVDEGEISVSPMARMSPPKLDEKPVPVIPKTNLTALLATCAGRSFDDRRDAALFRMFLNTGARLSEIASLSLDDVDTQYRQVTVMGKGRKMRTLPLGPKAMQALMRYLRVRRGHTFADSPMLWIGLRGPLTDNGITQLLRRRCRQAGLAQLHPHQFRHTFSHEWLARGGTDDE